MIDDSEMIESIRKLAGKAGSKERKTFVKCCLKIVDNHYNNEELNRLRDFKVSKPENWELFHKIVSDYCDYGNDKTSELECHDFPCEALSAIIDEKDAQSEHFSACAYGIVCPDFFALNGFMDVRSQQNVNIMKKHYPEC